MDSTDPQPLRRGERIAAAVALSALAVASLVAAGTHETVPPRKPQKPPAYIAGGVWGGT